jgi:hypothetical protein
MIRGRPRARTGEFPISDAARPREWRFADDVVIERHD